MAENEFYKELIKLEDEVGIRILPFSKESIESLNPDNEKSKGLTPDQKKLHWENYAKTTARQELVFKKVFDNVFNEQKNQVVGSLEKT